MRCFWRWETARYIRSMFPMSRWSTHRSRLGNATWVHSAAHMPVQRNGNVGVEPSAPKGVPTFLAQEAVAGGAAHCHIECVDQQSDWRLHAVSGVGQRLSEWGAELPGTSEGQLDWHLPQCDHAPGACSPGLQLNAVYHFHHMCRQSRSTALQGADATAVHAVVDPQWHRCGDPARPAACQHWRAGPESAIKHPLVLTSPYVLNLHLWKGCRYLCI